MKRPGWPDRLHAFASHCRLGRASPDRDAVNYPVNEFLAHARCVTIHVVFVNGQQVPRGSLEAAVAGFSQYLAGEVHLAEKRFVQLAPDKDGRLTIPELEPVLADSSRTTPCSIRIVLVPALSDFPHRGLCMPQSSEGTIIYINARRMHSDIARLFPPRVWWRVVLQHELLHSLGVPASRLRRWRGAHCTNPACILYAPVDLASVVAGILHLGFPRGLCRDCARDVKAAQQENARWVEAGDPYDPLVLLDRLVQLNPDDPHAYTARAAAYYEAGDPDRAIADYDKALALDSSDALAYGNRGLVHSRAGNLEQAVADLCKAVELEPQRALRYRMRASAYLRAGQFSMAVADLELCLKLDSTDAIARNNLAGLLATCDDEQIRDVPRAIELAQQACESTRRTAPWALVTLAGAYAESGQYDLAVKSQQEAIALTGETQQDMARVLELYAAGKPYRDRKTGDAVVVS